MYHVCCVCCVSCVVCYAYAFVLLYVCVSGVLCLLSYLTPAPTSHPPPGALPTFDKTLDVRKLENKRFKKFVASAEQEDRCNGLNLQSLLIMPVQRMPRYKLMLDEIIKRTDACSCVQYDKLYFM